MPLFGPIVEWIDARPDATGFLVAIPPTMQRTGITFRALFDRWNRAHPDKKLPNPHRCRHTIATSLMIGGADILTVSRLLRHASIQTTTRIYVQAGAVALRENIDRALPDVMRGNKKSAEPKPDAP